MEKPLFLNMVPLAEVPSKKYHVPKIKCFAPMFIHWKLTNYQGLKRWIYTLYVTLRSKVMNLPPRGRSSVLVISVVGRREKPDTKSVELRPVTRMVWALLLWINSFQWPGVGAFTLTTLAFLRSSNSFRPENTVIVRPVQAQNNISSQQYMFIFITSVDDYCKPTCRYER